MRRWSAVLIGLLWIQGRNASAQTNDELTQGRQLFTEALDDEDHHRYAVALEKYQRVAKIKETAAVRFRMGNTLEALGKPTQAIDSYNAAVSLAGPGDAKIAKASKARIDELEPKVAHLTIRVRPPTNGSEVRIDDALIPPMSVEDARLDPGPHAIVVSAPGMQDAHANVTLSAGGRAEIPIALEPSPVTPPPTPPSTAPVDEHHQGPPLVPLGVAILGGAFVISGFVLLGVRHSAISDLKEACPGGQCPVSRADELRSTRDHALLEGPLAVTFLTVGLIGIGAGVYLWLRDRGHAE
jgi:hypothetical protein